MEKKIPIYDFIVILHLYSCKFTTLGLFFPNENIQNWFFNEMPLTLNGILTLQHTWVNQTIDFLNYMAPFVITMWSILQNYLGLYFGAFDTGVSKQHLNDYQQKTSQW